MDSNIQRIEPNVFQGDFSDATVYLYNNQLTRFEESVFRTMLEQMTSPQSTGSIIAHGNPFDCDTDPCHLSWLISSKDSKLLKAVKGARCSNGIHFKDLETELYNYCENALKGPADFGQKKCHDDFSPCTCKTAFRMINLDCVGINSADVRQILNQSPPSIFDWFFLRLSSTDLEPVSVELFNKREFREVNIICPSRDYLLKVDGNNSTSLTPGNLRNLKLVNCDLSELDLSFLNHFEKLTSLDFIQSSNFHDTFSTLPPLMKLHQLSFVGCFGLNQLISFPTLASGIRSLTLQWNNDMDDTTASRILNWIAQSSSSTLVRISSRSNRLMDRVPPEIFKFTQLEYMILTSNTISFVNTLLSNNLVELSLSNSRLNNIQQGAFQGNFSRLRKVSLINNKMTKFEASVFLDVLQEMASSDDSKLFNIENNPFDCFSDPCHLAWLIRDHPSLMKIVKGGRCSNGTRFEDLNRFSDCPTALIAFRDPDGSHSDLEVVHANNGSKTLELEVETRNEKELPIINTGSLIFVGPAEHVFLNDSQILHIETYAFQGDFSNSTVHLYNNQLTRFDESVFRNILEQMTSPHSTGLIDVSENPFDCDSEPCHLSWLISTKNPEFLPAVRGAKCSNGAQFNELDSKLYSTCEFALKGTNPGPENCSVDFSPCTCKIGKTMTKLDCDGIKSAVQISDLLKPFKPSVNNWFYLRLRAQTESEPIPIELLINNPFKELNIVCPTRDYQLKVSGNTNNTSKAPRSLILVNCDLSQLDFSFMAIFENLVFFTMIQTSNFHETFSAFPPLKKIHELAFIGCSGLDQLTDFPILAKGIKQLKLQWNNDMDDETASRLLTWISQSSKSTLTRITSRSNRLMERIPPEISQFAELKYLTLNGNFNSFVSPLLLNKLQEVDLSNSRLQTIESGVFEGKSRVLRKVFLNNNQITRFEKTVFLHVLQELASSRNTDATLDIENNPFDCDTDPCHLAWLIRDHSNLMRIVKNGKCSNGTKLEDIQGINDCPTLASDSAMTTSIPEPDEFEEEEFEE